jgi:hypothetical protein
MEVGQAKILLDTGRSKFWIIENFGPDLLEQLKTLSLEVEPPIVVLGKACHQRRNVGFFSECSKHSGA